MESAERERKRQYSGTKFEIAASRYLDDLLVEIHSDLEAFEKEFPGASVKASRTDEGIRVCHDLNDVVAEVLIYADAQTRRLGYRFSLTPEFDKELSASDDGGTIVLSGRAGVSERNLVFRRSALSPVLFYHLSVQWRHT